MKIYMKKQRNGCSSVKFIKSNCTCNLSGTQATGTNIYRFCISVYNSLYFSDVRLPGSVWSSVWVADFDSKGNTLAADIAFCHVQTPPISKTLSKHNYSTTDFSIMQVFFEKNLDCGRLLPIIYIKIAVFTKNELK